MKTSPYTKFAGVYDLMGADDFSVKMTDYCFRIFRRFNINPATGLDLCCGTGSAISRFAGHGILMSGLDRSPYMLAIAAAKLKGHKVTLYQKPLPRFRILDSSESTKTRQFDLITCFFDSLNYLKNERELKTAFRSVRQHLAPGGWFIFDMNTPEAMKTLWGSQIFVQTTDTLYTIWRNEHFPETKSAACHATFFQKKSENIWERFDEVHTERAYSNTTIVKALRDTGFEVKGFYRCFTFVKPVKDDPRICGVAKKPAGAG